MAVSYAIIGGTGVYDPKILTDTREEKVHTNYGDVVVKVGSYHGKEIAFLPRHGAKHSVPPHLINYRANISALKQLGVTKILATAAVGSLNPAMLPGDFVLVDQFMDFTKNRAATFFEGGSQGVVHIDLTEPYCKELRGVMKTAAGQLGLRLSEGGNYVCTEGPRFETPAEIRMYRMLGGDLVGMTSCPEVALSREAEMCYATVAMVTNFAAGISPTCLTHSEVVETMRQNGEKLRQLVMKTMELITEERSCACQAALKELGMF
ncbi:MAG TPA: S-methyl-5'-thioadenosine phosphorylase [Bacillota bacterium]|nr:S-methyl-5'-thioadenosine phosphorylase [Bacillota bacterium]